MLLRKGHNEDRWHAITDSPARARPAGPLHGQGLQALGLKPVRDALYLRPAPAGSG
jgi:hypothetical protein